MIGTIPVSYFYGWQKIWKLPRITLHAGTQAFDKCRKTNYPPYRYKDPTGMKSSHCIQLNMEYWRPHVYPDLTQTLELCTLFKITLLITPLIVLKYLRLIKEQKICQILWAWHVLPYCNYCTKSGHVYSCHITWQVAMYNVLLHFQTLQVYICLSYNHMPIRYNVLHTPILPAGVSKAAVYY
jgi:hypothetical protein